MYLLVDEATGEAAVVDPYDAPKIHEAAQKEGVNVRLWTWPTPNRR
jgi:hydroxyacylglutathione hydrolase